MKTTKIQRRKSDWIVSIPVEMQEQMEDADSLCVKSNKNGIVYFPRDGLNEFRTTVAKILHMDEITRHETVYDLCTYKNCDQQGTQFLKMEMFGMPFNITICDKHQAMLFEFQEYEAHGFTHMHENGSPIVYGKEEGNLFKFFCKFCQKEHTHGKGEGHRVAHCDNPDSPYLKTGYNLKIGRNV